jgi:hypothetical protein
MFIGAFPGATNTNRSSQPLLFHSIDSSNASHIGFISLNYLGNIVFNPCNTLGTTCGILESTKQHQFDAGVLMMPVTASGSASPSQPINMRTWTGTTTCTPYFDSFDVAGSAVEFLFLPGSCADPVMLQSDYLEMRDVVNAPLLITNGNGKIMAGSPSAIETPVRAGTWSITSSTSTTVTFTTAMSIAPHGCMVSPTASSAATGQPYATGFTATGFTVNIPTSGTISGTYQCVLNNAY